jgi:hypothetical protein
MSDQSPKPVQMASVGMMSITGMGGAAVGDQFANALAKVVAWIIAVKCQCAPPPDVIDGLHTICLVAVVGLGFLLHSMLMKKPQT